MFCISCGEKIPIDAHFCRSCGTKVQFETKTKKRKIPTLFLLLALLAFIASISTATYVLSAKSSVKKVSATKSIEKNPATPQNCNIDKTTQDIEHCTLKVGTDIKQGTGIAFDTGYVLTNKHVIASSKSITVTDENKKTYKAQLWNYAKDTDIAILKVSGISRICSLTSRSATKGEKVRALGFPQDLQDNSDPVLTEGVVSKFLSDDMGDQLIRVDATINPGNSGGPLFNECGIIGMNTLKLVNEGVENAGYAIANITILNQIQQLIATGGNISVPTTNTDDIAKNNSSNDTNLYSEADIEKVKTIKSVIDKKRTAWNNYTVDDFDRNKVDKIKDLIVRMSNVTDNILPKIVNHQKITDEEIRFMKDLLSMFNTLIASESDLGISSDANFDYYFAKCSNKACVKSSGIGKNTCDSDYDCIPKYHTECRNMACVQVEGVAINGCLSNNDCFHYTCDSGACKQVPGKGIDQCYADIYCKHTECAGNKCTIVNTPGTSACSSDDMCK